MRMRNAVRGSSLKAPLYYWSFSLLLIFLLAHVAESVLGEDGICNIFAFVPFTIDDMPSICLDVGRDCSNPGFTQMIAAILAVEVFNARDSTIVPELALPVYQNCAIQLADMHGSTQNQNQNNNISSSAVFNTRTVGHSAAESLLLQTDYPCAVVGPFNDMPAQELSSLAAAAHFPVTVHRAFNLRVVSDTFSPYTSQVYPDMERTAAQLVQFLLHKGRTDYVAFLYTLTDTGVQQSTIFSLAFEESCLQHHTTISYISPSETPRGRPAPVSEDESSSKKSSSRSNSNTCISSSGSTTGTSTSTTDEETVASSVRRALEQVVRTGYRTIVLAMAVPIRELPVIANAAQELGLLSGEYFWIFTGNIDPMLLTVNNTNLTNLMAGSAWLAPVELHFSEPDTNLFLKAWLRSNATQVDQANVANPMKKGEGGYFFAEPNFFETYLPGYGDGFMFDSVMATGMGACLAAASKPTNTPVWNPNENSWSQNVNEFGNDNSIGGRAATASAHVRGIRSVDFQGASGRVKFGESDGTRLESTVHWGVFNLIPSLDPFVPVDLSEIYLNGTWTNVTNFVYADGTTEPPKLLRDTPEQNYVNSAIRGLGLAFMGLVILMALITVVWVYIHREHRVLRGAQPHFLYVLAVGSAISASTLIPISLDERNGLSEEQLSKACMSIPWLLSLGHIITYGALFSKLWRINKVLQFSRRKINIRQVVWPTIILEGLALFVLSMWTGLDAFQWEREEVNEVTGESIGQCQSEHMGSFLTALVILMLIPTIMTGYMAYVTKDVDDVYSESQWIFTMIVVQTEVIFVAVPTLIILRDVSTDGLFIILMFLVLTFPSSALGFIIVPKVFAYNEAIRSANNPSSRKSSVRGNAKGSVLVTGLRETPAPSYANDFNSGISGITSSPGTPHNSSFQVESHTSGTPHNLQVESHTSGTDAQPADLPSGMQEEEEEQKQQPSSASVVNNSNPGDCEEACVQSSLPLASQPQQASTELNSRGIDDISAAQLPLSPELSSAIDMDNSNPSGSDAAGVSNGFPLTSQPQHTSSELNSGGIDEISASHLFPSPEQSGAIVADNSNPSDCEEAGVSNNIPPASQPQHTSSELGSRGIDELSAAQLPSPPE